MHAFDMLRLVEETITLLQEQSPSERRNLALEKWIMFRDKLASQIRPVPTIAGCHVQSHEGSLV